MKLVWLQSEFTVLYDTSGEKHIQFNLCWKEHFSLVLLTIIFILWWVILVCYVNLNNLIYQEYLVINVFVTYFQKYFHPICSHFQLTMLFLGFSAMWKTYTAFWRWQSLMKTEIIKLNSWVKFQFHYWRSGMEKRNGKYDVTLYCPYTASSLHIYICILKS